jgi:PEGA domain
MRPSRRHCIYASLVLLVSSLLAARSHAETLTITSTPPGATVEMDGVIVGTTPFTTDFPGGYFHKPHTVFGSRLNHALTAEVSMGGYLTRRVTLTDGPFEWIAVNGRQRGNYFLLKSSRFDINLDSVAVQRAPAGTIGHDGPLAPASTSSLRVDRDKLPPGGSVMIASDPSGADIYIDGKFVGQAPSTIDLPAGSHHIEVKSAGKLPWARDLEVLKDSQLTLHPVLGASP